MLIVKFQKKDDESNLPEREDERRFHLCKDNNEDDIQAAFYLALVFI